MQPLTLTATEIRHALEKREVTLARPVEPQPDKKGEWIRENIETFDASPFGKIGDEFFAQEEWFAYTGHGAILPKYEATKDSCIIGYKADMKDEFETEYREPSTMPQWASRLHLIHKSTEVKRVQDEADSIGFQLGFKQFKRGIFLVSAGYQFKDQWQSQYGKDYPWDSNPWLFIGRLEVKYGC